MAIIKVSQSGKGIVFVDDFGNVYCCSKTYLLSLVGGRMKAPFVELTRMPMPVSDDRFKKSPLLIKDQEKVREGEPGWVPPVGAGDPSGVGTVSDGLSPKSREERKTAQAFRDKTVW